MMIRLTVSVLFLYFSAASAQPALPRLQTGAPLTFEVASIKLQPWTNEGRVGVFVRGDTLTGEHVDLYQLVEFAYGLSTDGVQVSGGPGWARMGLTDVSGAGSVLYQVIAKAGYTAPRDVE